MLTFSQHMMKFDACNRRVRTIKRFEAFHCLCDFSESILQAAAHNAQPSGEQSSDQLTVRAQRLALQRLDS